LIFNIPGDPGVQVYQVFLSAAIHLAAVVAAAANISIGVLFLFSRRGFLQLMMGCFELTATLEILFSIACKMNEFLLYSFFLIEFINGIKKDGHF
jgi:hypothetical protein